MKRRIALDGRMYDLEEGQFEALATGRSNPAPLVSFDQRILRRICDDGVSLSSVTIAAEEWRGKSDPVTVFTVENAIVELNRAGLVTYRLGVRGVLCHIKPTQQGWLAAGYPPPSVVIGNRWRSYKDDSPRHPGDHTDFRTLFDVAIGGPIERMPLAEHLVKYPDHAAIHPTPEGEPMVAIATAARHLQGQDLAKISSLPIDEIIERFSVDKRTAYAIRRDATRDLMAEGAPTSLSDHILKILRNGPVKDVSDLRAALRLLINGPSSSLDVTKSIWSLQKRNLVTFYERKHGTDSLITKIKLTKQGMRELGIIGEHDSPRPDKVKPSRELRHRSPVGVDYTDAKNQPTRTNGGPIERTGERPHKPEIIPTPEYKVPVEVTPRYSGDTPLPQNMKPFIDEAPPEAQRKDAEAQHKDVETDTHTQYRHAAVDISKYPHLKKILEKTEKFERYEQAAALLLDDEPQMATALLETIQLTDVEKEVVALLKELNG